jgi:microcystin-dependent protein
MPSSYTSNLAFEKPANGEQVGTWGTTVNDNMDIVDRLTSQVGSIVLTGTTYTLTTSGSGALSDGHYSLIKFTGSPGGTCTVTIDPNSIQRIYTIYNTTNQTVVMSQGSGSTVSVPAGEAAQLYADGAGSGAAVTLVSDKLRGIVPAGVVPSGGIIMWSGSVASIPSGWFLCDGTNSTPDLRDRFVVGAGSSYAVGATGGADSVTLSTSQIPSHSHSFSATTGGSGSHSHTYSGTTSTVSNDHTHNFSGTTSTIGDHTHSIPDGAGVDGAQALEAGGVIGTIQSGAAGAHSHTFGGTTSGISTNHTHTFSGTTSGIGDHTHSVSGTTGTTGSGSSHENRPPYYALAYIMKA